MSSRLAGKVLAYCPTSGTPRSQEAIAASEERFLSRGPLGARDCVNMIYNGIGSNVMMGCAEDLNA